MKPVKEKSKAKAKAKPKIKITKQPVEPIKQEPEQVVEEKPKNNKLKEMAQCTDCGLSMNQHTLKYIHKKRRCCKGALQEEVK